MGLFRRNRDADLYWGDPQQTPRTGTPANPAKQVGDHATGLGHRPVVDPSGSAPLGVSAGASGSGSARRPVLLWLIVVLVLLGAGAAALVARGPTSDPDPGVAAPATGMATTRIESPTVSSPTSTPESADSEAAATTRSAAGVVQQTRVPTGRQGKATEVAFGDNTFRVTVGRAIWQAAARWGHAGDAEKGYLIVPITVHRTDRGDHVSQISWGDWSLVNPSARIEAELIGGGYQSDAVSTIRLDPGDTVAGNLVFDAKAEAATLTLRDSARWALAAPKAYRTPKPVPLDTTIRGKDVPGEVPFDATVSTVEWFANGDPTLESSMRNGYFLAITFTVRPHADIDPNVAFVLYHNWSARLGDGTFRGASGTYNNHPAGTVNLTGGKPVTGYAIFDAPGLGGTVSLIGKDGEPLMSWTIPGPS